MRDLVPPCGEFLGSLLQEGGGLGGEGGEARADENADPLCGPKRSLKPNRMYADAWKSRWGRKPRPSHPCH